ncbi:MAG: hypothetical protein ACLFQV_13905 [Vulcanimicrobiota bacterium]
MNRLCFKRNLKNSRGFSLLDIFIVLAIVVAIYFIAIQARDKYYNFIVKSQAIKLIINLENLKSDAIAKTKNTHITFRPVDGPYTNYTITDELGETATHELSGSVKMINTNGFIINHKIYANAFGQFCDEDGKELVKPNPGLLIFFSDKASELTILRIDLETEKIQMD